MTNPSIGAGPPPSTLTAQLVEDIRVTQEREPVSQVGDVNLLLAEIEQVKRKPDLIETDEDRLRHNHLLIYVNCIVMLDRPRWQSAFNSAAKEEVSKSMQFLKVTIKETPEVLRYRVNGDKFALRGREALWAWLLPRILPLLSHATFESIVKEIEDLAGLIATVLMQDEAQGGSFTLFVLYMNSTVDALLNGATALLDKPDEFNRLNMTVPPRGVQKQVTGLKSVSDNEALTYNVSSVSEAFHQVTSILQVVLQGCLTYDGNEHVADVRNAMEWIQFTIPDMLSKSSGLILIRHESIMAFIEKFVAFAKTLEPESASDAVMSLALPCMAQLCGRVLKGSANFSSDLAGAQARRAVAYALVYLAKLLYCGFPDVPDVRMDVVTHIWQPLERILEGEFLDDNDFTESCRLIQAVLRDATIEVWQPDKFADRELERLVGSVAHAPGHAYLPIKFSLEPATDERYGGNYLIKNRAMRLALQLFGSRDDSLDPAGISRLVQDNFGNVPENDQVTLILLLASIPCSMEGTLGVRTKANDLDVVSCALCSNAKLDLGVVATQNYGGETAFAYEAFSRVVEHPAYKSSRRLRLTGMGAMRTLIRHSNDPKHIMLESSRLGNLCLAGLRSSQRPIRVEAGLTLVTFLHSPDGFPTKCIPPDVRKANLATALGFLKSVVDEAGDDHSILETTILAWGQIARVAPEDELIFVLFSLLDNLKGDNPSVAEFTASELWAIANYKSITTRQLFQPFWSSMAYSAVKDAVTRPHAIAAVAVALRIPVQELLLSTQAHSLPYLVLFGCKDVITKIYEARKEDQNWDALWDSANLGPILSFLLQQPQAEDEDWVVRILREIDSHFEPMTVSDLIRSDPVMTAVGLLKALRTANAQLTGRIEGALDLVAKSTLPPSADKASNTVEARNARISRFLKTHLLGLVASLTDVINAAQNPNVSLREQNACIRALKEIIRLCRSDVKLARAQVSACLISALDQKELRTAAISCWTDLITFLDPEDVAVLAQPTFCLVPHYWDGMDDEAKAYSFDMLTVMMTTHRDEVCQNSHLWPSLDHIPDLQQITKLLKLWRWPLDQKTALGHFAERLTHETSFVVLQTAIQLKEYLLSESEYIQAAAAREQPEPVLATLMRSLLDCASKYNGVTNEQKLTSLCTECIGLIGCLDSNKLEKTRERPQFLVMKNFEDAEEAKDFVLFALKEVLIKKFLSTSSNIQLQGFLAWVMQELLDRCQFRAIVCGLDGPYTAMDYESTLKKWLKLPDSAREVLSPFLTSRYSLTEMVWQEVTYPIFKDGSQTPYAVWLRTFVIDLLRREQGIIGPAIFEPLTRVVKIKDFEVGEFLLPYAVMYVVLGQRSTKEERENVVNELNRVLRFKFPDDAPYSARGEEMKLFYEAVFRVLDYATQLLQAKKSLASRNHGDDGVIERIQALQDAIPAELISERAVDCKEFGRAMFQLELHIRRIKETNKDPAAISEYQNRLLDIYEQIDEPDSMDGMCAYLKMVDINRQMLSHCKAGRWAAAQPWSEWRLTQEPENPDRQIDLLKCLRGAGQQDVLLNYVGGLATKPGTRNKIVSYAAEAAWATARWPLLQKYVSLYEGDPTEDFNVGVGHLLLKLKDRGVDDAKDHLTALRTRTATAMTFSQTSSLQSSHDLMLQCQVLTELEDIFEARIKWPQGIEAQQANKFHDTRRLDVLGAYVGDKQYVMGIRRAALEVVRPTFSDSDISKSWLLSARVARKAGSMSNALGCVLRAQQLGNFEAAMENAKLQWVDGHHRKAINILQDAIKSKAFGDVVTGQSLAAASRTAVPPQNMVAARAHLRLAKWLDYAGQTNASALRAQYQEAPKLYGQWEKGHYYLGRYYKKILDSEKALKPDDQSDAFLAGETAKLVVENYLRSLLYGNKYLYQTLPCVLTLWLELGAQVNKAPEGKVSLARELQQRRQIHLAELHRYLVKNISRMPAYIFYTALPQIVARIAHPNEKVFEVLEAMITKVVEAYPQQSIWHLFPFMTAKLQSERRVRGQSIMMKLRSCGAKVATTSASVSTMLRQSEKVAHQLLLACNNGDFQSGRSTNASITKDLGFNHNCTPSLLVVPVEKCLHATLPTLTDNRKKHLAFSRDVITIHHFLDEVLVLGSLAKPRKLLARGSDGQTYALLLKPKDDMRTDQRLMEFNSMINRSLKRDPESSIRQLYIRTYAVMPINEECGIIEWVDGLKTLREILLGLYKARMIHPNYTQIAQMMRDAASSHENLKIFTEGVLGMFPSVLPNWFIQRFPHPSAWFAARLRYTRSAAVMSMVGTILGLGDRHGENVLLEEGNGGVFHVDFNCLFDKGLTFQQPERVPFRLTHNMLAAMGIQGYEGPFRACSEITLRILRSQEETLMTILEAFIYDPTLDLQRADKRTASRHHANGGLRLSPQSVVESIRRKVRGLLPDESIPLGVEGQVDALIKLAVDPMNLASMYIGWCPFL